MGWKGRSCLNELNKVKLIAYITGAYPVLLDRSDARILPNLIFWFDVLYRSAFELFYKEKCSGQTRAEAFSAFKSLSKDIKKVNSLGHN